MYTFVQLVVSGISTGALYGLVALSLVLVFRGTGVVSFAAGDMVTAGAFIAVVMLRNHHASLSSSVLVVAAGGVILGALAYVIAVEGLRRPSPHLYLISTLAVGYLIRGSLRLHFGGYVYDVRPIFGGGVVHAGAFSISTQNLGIVVVSAVLMLLLFVFLEFSRLGTAVRATSSSRTDAELMGIPVRWMSVLVWATGGLLAGVAGLLLAPSGGVTPDVGGNILVPAFVGAVIGGFESLLGAVVGGIAVGILQNMVGYYISTSIRDIVVFSLLIVFLAVRPTGIFGSQRVVRV
jgi:branched-chain amino acid transport system permease protein